MALYEELGGDEAITMAPDRFYEKVLADPSMSIYFEDVDVDQVKRHQRAFLVLGVDDAKVDEVMAIANTGKADVLAQ